MADFNTHILGAAAVVSLGATCATKLLSLSMPEGLMLMVVGVIGGVLPDLDLRSSQPSKALFAVLGVFAALAWLFASMSYFTGIELWLGTLVVFMLVRYPLAYGFHRMTTHRGVFHSLIAALMAGVVTSALAWQHMGTSALQSWLLGLSLMGGYLVHLALDEIYSVDFTGARFKRSFGTALKPLAMQQLPASLLVIFITIVAFFWSPPYQQAITQLLDRYTDWQSALIPTWL